MGTIIVIVILVGLVGLLNFFARMRARGEDVEAYFKELMQPVDRYLKKLFQPESESEKQKRKEFDKSPSGIMIKLFGLFLLCIVTFGVALPFIFFYYLIKIALK